MIECHIKAPQGPGVLEINVKDAGESIRLEVSFPEAKPESRDCGSGPCGQTIQEKNSHTLSAHESKTQRFAQECKSHQPGLEGQSAPFRPGSDHTYSSFEDALTFLKSQPPAVSGSGGLMQTFRVIKELLTRGLGEVLVFAAMMLDWNARCNPPWDPAELFKEIRKLDMRLALEGDL